MPMIGWFDPAQLLVTGAQTLAALVVGQRSDQRIVQALAARETEHFDYTVCYTDAPTGPCADPARPREEILNRSYFALKPPGGWWLLGSDGQLQSDLDTPQIEYFREIAARHMRHGDQVILCLSVPVWIYAHKYRQLGRVFDETDLLYLRDYVLAPRGIEVSVLLAGDLHHYRRHEEADDAGAENHGGRGRCLPARDARRGRRPDHGGGAAARGAPRPATSRYVFEWVSVKLGRHLLHHLERRDRFGLARAGPALHAPAPGRRARLRRRVDRGVDRDGPLP